MFDSFNGFKSNSTSTPTVFDRGGDGGDIGERPSGIKILPWAQRALKFTKALPRTSHFNQRKRAVAMHLNLRICLNLTWRSNSRRRPLSGAAGGQMDRFRLLCFTARSRAHRGAIASARAGGKRAHWGYLIWRGEFASCPSPAPHVIMIMAFAYFRTRPCYLGETSGGLG